MLNMLPIELVEECLLYLGLNDLISVVKTNRRLYAIAHSKKTPLRHRLTEQCISLTLDVGRAQLAKNDVCDCKGLEGVRLTATDLLVGPIPMFTLLINPCICSMLDLEREIESRQLRRPARLLPKFIDFEEGFDVRIKYSDVAQALDDFPAFLFYLLHHCNVEFITLNIFQDLSIWNKLSSFFDKHPPSVRGKVRIFVESHEQLYSADILDCRLFEHTTIESFDACSIKDDSCLYQDALKKPQEVAIYGSEGNPLSISDSLLLSLFEKTTRLCLAYAKQLTADGLAKFVETFYSCRQAENRSIMIDPVEERPLQYYLTRIPREAYRWEGEGKRAVITNLHGQQWVLCQTVHYNFEIFHVD